MAMVICLSVRCSWPGVRAFVSTPTWCLPLLRQGLMSFDAILNLVKDLAVIMIAKQHVHRVREGTEDVSQQDEDGLYC